MKTFLVIGNPIAHSKSPIIHKVFAEETGISLRYNACLLDLDDFKSSVTSFFSEGLNGANITLPFKEQAYDICEQVTERAELSKAVNTLYVDNNRLCGDNTDGQGLVNDLIYHNIRLLNKRVLLLGAGGAARGAVPALIESGLSELVIANRTVEKAHQIANEINKPNVLATSLNLIEGKFDIVINATSSSVSGAIPSLSTSVIESCSAFYDMFYSKNTTAFLAYVASVNPNASCIDGIGMLIEQAAEAFYVWHGVKPPTEKVRELLIAD